MKKSKGIISLILTVVLIALLGFTTVVGFGKGQTGAAKNIKLGLDLEGGVSITYQVKGETPSAEDMSDTIYKLQKRVEQYSTEATVYQEGDNRISIEIPGVTDANEILSELGQPGSLYFIKEKDSDGNPNYGLDTSGHYVLAKDIEELKEEGSVVLNGTDVKSAKAGAYQDQISGYGGIKHCLIPSPKHVIVGYDKNGKLTDWVYAKQQTAQSMLKILGYK